MKKKPLRFTLFVFLFLGLTVSGILFFYYKGDRNSYLNTAINNFSKNNPQLSINLKKATKALDVLYIFHQLIPSDIPTYTLTIKGNDLLRLNTNLPENDRLTAEYKKYIPAQFSYQGKTWNVKVRYRGDNPNHWRFSKKSWRVKFKNYFEGQEAINLILPEDRYFFIEPWISRMGKKLGLVTPEFSLVNLVVNGQSGAYLKSEQWGEAFLKNHGLSEKADLYGEAEFDKPVSNLYTDVSNFKKYTFNPDNPQDDFSNLQALLDLINHTSDQEFFDQLPQLVDIDNFLLWQAQSALGFSHSQKRSHNLVTYFNPDINKFQFIPWNVSMADIHPDNPDYDYNPLMTRVLFNPDYMFKRNLILWQYISNQDNLIDDLDYYDQLYQSSRGDFYRDSQKIFPNLDFDLRVRKYRKRIVAAQQKIKQLLNDARAQIKIEQNFQLESSVLAYLVIESQGFSSLQIKKISLDLDKTANLSLIKDTNQNQRLDVNDQNLGSFNLLRNNHYFLEPDHILIHTQRELGLPQQPFQLKPTQQGFFITASNFNQATNIQTELINAITQEPIQIDK